jgi:hypothetical protein
MPTFITKRTASDGKELENRVHTLLSLKGAQNLCREKQSSTKKFDLYFETNLEPAPEICTGR